MKTEQPYNPLDRLNLGISVTQALLSREPRPLDKIESFNGAGVYCIYYVGNFAAYKKVADANRDGKFGLPIYVGKAIPKGSGRSLVSDATVASFSLSDRLKEHAESIKAASNLDVKDFFCRYLVVEDIWIPLGESLLISRYAPLWNFHLVGFGNHDPGSGRYNQKRSPWDVVHSGRGWAKKLKDHPKSSEGLQMECFAYLQQGSKVRELPLEEEEAE
jgi:hypothetical protein